MSADATRIDRVEVSVSFMAAGHGVSHSLNEKEARDLMHALAGALGYQAVPLVGAK